MQGSEADGEREDLTAAAAAAEQTESTIAGPGDAFGEVGLFADIGGAFQGETARVDSEEADLYVLPAGRVAELEGRYPAEMRRLRELCEMRAAEALVRARDAGAAPRPAEGSLAGCRCSSCGPPAVVPIPGFGCLRFDRPTHPPTHPPLHTHTHAPPDTEPPGRRVPFFHRNIEPALCCCGEGSGRFEGRFRLARRFPCSGGIEPERGPTAVGRT